MTHRSLQVWLVCINPCLTSPWPQKGSGELPITSSTLCYRHCRQECTFCRSGCAPHLWELLCGLWPRQAAVFSPHCLLQDWPVPRPRCSPSSLVWGFCCLLIVSKMFGSFSFFFLSLPPSPLPSLFLLILVGKGEMSTFCLPLKNWNSGTVWKHLVTWHYRTHFIEYLFLITKMLFVSVYLKAPVHHKQEYPDTFKWSLW